MSSLRVYYFDLVHQTLALRRKLTRRTVLQRRAPHRALLAPALLPRDGLLQRSLQPLHLALDALHCFVLALQIGTGRFRCLQQSLAVGRGSLQVSNSGAVHLLDLLELRLRLRLHHFQLVTRLFHGFERFADTALGGCGLGRQLVLVPLLGRRQRLLGPLFLRTRLAHLLLHAAQGSLAVIGAHRLSLQLLLCSTQRRRQPLPLASDAAMASMCSV